MLWHYGFTTDFSGNKIRPLLVKLYSVAYRNNLKTHTKLSVLKFPCLFLIFPLFPHFTSLSFLYSLNINLPFTCLSLHFPPPSYHRLLSFSMLISPPSVPYPVPLSHRKQNQELEEKEGSWATIIFLSQLS